MYKLAVVTCLLIVACSKKTDKTAEPPAATADKPTPVAVDTPAPIAKTTEPAVAASGAIKLGDATVVELVDRRYKKRDKPARSLVLRADGTAELINDKTDKPWLTVTLKPDGTLIGGDKPMAKLTADSIIDPTTSKPIHELAGNTVTIAIEGKRVQVTLGDDGNITVLDSPYGNKWRVEASDPAVRRTAFLVFAVVAMKSALD